MAIRGQFGGLQVLHEKFDGISAKLPTGKSTEHRLGQRFQVRDGLASLYFSVAQLLEDRSPLQELVHQSTQGLH